MEGLTWQAYTCLVVWPWLIRRGSIYPLVHAMVKIMVMILLMVNLCPLSLRMPYLKQSSFPLEQKTIVTYRSLSIMSPMHLSPPSRTPCSTTFQWIRNTGSIVITCASRHVTRGMSLTVVATGPQTIPVGAR